MPQEQRSPDANERPPKRVVMLAFEGASTLDTIGPIDVLAGTKVALLDDRPPYQVDLISLDGGSVATGPSGVSLLTIAAADLPDGPIDTFLISGGEHVSRRTNDMRLLELIRGLDQRATRTASICTGAFLLAAAGLLDGRRATTHWRWAEELSKTYDKVDVRKDNIFVQDGKYFTSAGITAGMDLALALIEQDFGARVALTVAQHWVMFLKRPGGQSQFSSFLPPSGAATDPIFKALVWAQNHLASDLTVPAMADYCNMSHRTFARRFVESVGSTPSKYIEQMRVQAAKSYLETTTMSVDLIAETTGFCNADRMRRSFNRILNVSPDAYRDRSRLPQ